MSRRRDPLDRALEDYEALSLTQRESFHQVVRRLHPQPVPAGKAKRARGKQTATAAAVAKGGSDGKDS
jgi:hypothetical protein